MAVILVVEDDALIRIVAEMMIKDWGHQTLSASDENEALAILRSPQHIDALFTDIYLKGSVLGGCDVADRAIEMRPNLRVLYTTGNSLTEEMKSLLIVGAHYLSKPYTQQQLHHSMTEMLGA